MKLSKRTKISVFCAQSRQMPHVDFDMVEGFRRVGHKDCNHTTFAYDTGGNGAPIQILTTRAKARSSAQLNDDVRNEIYARSVSFPFRPGYFDFSVYYKQPTDDRGTPGSKYAKVMSTGTGIKMGRTRVRLAGGFLVACKTSRKKKEEFRVTFTRQPR